MTEQNQKEISKFIEGGFHEGVGYDDRQNPAGEIDGFPEIPDDQLKTQIITSLHDDFHLDASDIIVDVHEGEVLLTGSVSNKAMMTLAIDCVDRVIGVKKIHNQLAII